MVLVACLLTVGFGVAVGSVEGVCPPQAVHVYGTGAPAGHHPHGVGLLISSPPATGSVSVVDTNIVDCDGIPTNAPDYDGDLDTGVGGAAFGWGPNAAACGPHNVHGSTVVVNDFVWGQAIAFVVAEDDQTATGCSTGGLISDLDTDDCISSVSFGTGSTCGSGGGDGLFWVIFVGANPPPFGGTVTSY